MAGPTDPRVTVADPLTGETSTVYVGTTGYVVVTGADRHVESDTLDEDGRRTIVIAPGAVVLAEGATQRQKLNSEEAR